MKFIKYAVGLVIALSVIPLVVVTVTNLDAPRLKTIEFEVVDYDSGEGVITFSENTFADIHSLAILDTNNDVNNLITVTLNDLNLINPQLTFHDNEYNYYDDDSSNDWEYLDDTNNASADSYNPTIGDKWTMTFDVSTEMPPLIKLLVGFAPLLLAGGVLLFMLNKRKLD